MKPECDDRVRLSKSDKNIGAGVIKYGIFTCYQMEKHLLLHRAVVH